MGSLLGGGFFLVEGGTSKFLASGGGPPFPAVGKTLHYVIIERQTALSSFSKNPL